MGIFSKCNCNTYIMLAAKFSPTNQREPESFKYGLLFFVSNQKESFKFRSYWISDFLWPIEFFKSKSVPALLFQV